MDESQSDYVPGLSEIDESGSDDQNIDIIINNNSHKSVLIFDLEVGTNDWELIKPIANLYRDQREYVNFQPGWTDVITDLIWIDKRLPCCWKFSNNHFYKRKNFPYFKFFGQCKDINCRAFITGSCQEEPVGPDFKCIIHIDTIDTRGIPHTAKRNLSGARRIAAKKDLIYEKAALFIKKKG